MFFPLFFSLCASRIQIHNVHLVFDSKYSILSLDVSSEIPSPFLVLNSTLPFVKKFSSFEEDLGQVYNDQSARGLDGQSTGRCHGHSKRCSLSFYTCFHLVNVTDQPFSITIGSYLEEPVTLSYSLEGSRPVFDYLRFYPETVNQGKDYYERFSNKHLSRNLSFYKEAVPQTTIFTLPRSGTHILSFMLAEILDEFVLLFPGSERERHLDREAGELRGTAENCRVMITHRFYKRDYFKIRIPKVVLMFKNPLTSLDSAFCTNIQTPAKSLECQYKKPRKGYERHPDFRDWVNDSLNRFLQMAQHNHRNLKDSLKLFVTYEDLVSRPFDILSEILSFLESIPAELTYKKAIQKTLKEKGLRSQYSHLVKEDPNKRSTEELFKDYPEEILRKIADSFEDFILFYGYNALYEKNMDWRPKDNFSMKPNYKEENKKTMEQIVKHTALEKENALYTDSKENKKAFSFENERKLSSALRQFMIDC